MQPQGDQKGREREAGVTLATKKNDMSSYQQHGGGMCAAQGERNFYFVTQETYTYTRYVYRAVNIIKTC